MIKACNMKFIMILIGAKTIKIEIQLNFNWNSTHTQLKFNNRETQQSWNSTNFNPISIEIQLKFNWNSIGSQYNSAQIQCVQQYIVWLISLFSISLCCSVLRILKANVWKIGALSKCKLQHLGTHIDIKTKSQTCMWSSLDALSTKTIILHNDTDPLCGWTVQTS